MEHSKPKVRRCAIYTAKVRKRASSRTSTRFTPSVKPARRSSRARRARVGSSAGPHTTTVGYRAVLWSGPHSSACSPISARASSM
jgi:hypothetical protein